MHVSDSTATRYLDQLEKEGKIEQVGKTGKYVNDAAGKRKKVIEVTFLLDNGSITTVVDMSSSAVMQVSRTEKYA